ncbi:MAG: hypothetical protein Q7S55_01875 [Nanoarchaeota archaeon]|nr:hypothetical protein [Nanoarchaeota archaeon]
MVGKDSSLVKIVDQSQLAGYRDNVNRGAEELFLRLRENHPELYSELMRLAKAELAENMPVKTESRFNWPTYLQNQVEVDGQNYAYVGVAMDFWFQGNDIRGNAKVTKLQKNKTIQKSWKLFPPRIDRRPVERYETVWSVQASEWKEKYLLCDGGTRIHGYGQSFYYRGALNNKLLENKIKLPHQLFEQIFAPIDAEILRIYQKLKKE